MTTYARLVSEAAERTNIPDIVTDVDILIPMAEQQLNRRLRVGDMEATATLTTDANGYADLPTGFLMSRAVMQGDYTVPKQPLPIMLAGARHGYAITGDRFLGGLPDADYSLTYYGAIPSLTTAGTNWLLTSNFECYLFSLMSQALSRAGRLDEAQGARSYAMALVDDINAQDARARLKGTIIRTAGATP